MSNKKKWWLYEIVSWLVIAVIVIVLPKMNNWQALILGLCIGLYAICYRRQDRLNR